MGNTYILTGTIFIILERSVLKKIIEGKDLKTYFGIAVPFNNEQIISVLIGVLIHYSINLWWEFIFLWNANSNYFHYFFHLFYLMRLMHKSFTQKIGGYGGKMSHYMEVKDSDYNVLREVIELLNKNKG